MPHDRRNAQDGPRSVARRDFVRSAALLAAGLVAAGRVDSATAGEPSQGAGRVREFIRKVQNARLFDLASVWDENSPIASVNPTYSMSLAATDRKSTRLNSSHITISYAVFCLKKKKSEK